MMWEWREGSWQDYSKDIINDTISREVSVPKDCETAWMLRQVGSKTQPGPRGQSKLLQWLFQCSDLLEIWGRGTWILHDNIIAYLVVQQQDSSCFTVVTRLQKSVRLELTRVSAVRVGDLGTQARGRYFLLSGPIWSHWSQLSKIKKKWS